MGGVVWNAVTVPEILNRLRKRSVAVASGVNRRRKRRRRSPLLAIASCGCCCCGGVSEEAPETGHQSEHHGEDTDLIPGVLALQGRQLPDKC